MPSYRATFENQLQRTTAILAHVSHNLYRLGEEILRLRTAVAESKLALTAVVAEAIGGGVAVDYENAKHEWVAVLFDIHQIPDRLDAAVVALVTENNGQPMVTAIEELARLDAAVAGIMAKLSGS